MAFYIRAPSVGVGRQRGRGGARLHFTASAGAAENLVTPLLCVVTTANLAKS